MMYTPEERKFLVDCYKEFSLSKVCDMFHVMYPNSGRPLPATVRKVVNRYRRTGTFETKKNRDRPKLVLTEEKQQELLEIVKKHSSITAREVAKMAGVSSTTVFTFFKKTDHKFVRPKKKKKTEGVVVKKEVDTLSYLNEEDSKKITRINQRKIKKLKEKIDILPYLTAEEQEQRNKFCEIMFEKINNDRLILHNILFNDIATFYISETTGYHEIEYLTKNNSSHFYSTKPVNASFKVNVWAGFIGFNIIGPFFIDGNLNINNCLQLIQYIVLPTLTDLNFNYKDIWFKHTGMYSRPIRNLLDLTFQNRWIGFGGGIEWPDNSSDFNPIEYFYWEYIKLNLFDLQEIKDTETFKQKILDVSETIKPLQIFNVINEFYDRINYSLIENGGKFEDKL